MLTRLDLKVSQPLGRSKAEVSDLRAIELFPALRRPIVVAHEGLVWVAHSELIRILCQMVFGEGRGHH